jgi:hypothetical protein
MAPAYPPSTILSRRWLDRTRAPAHRDLRPHPLLTVSLEREDDDARERIHFHLHGDPAPESWQDVAVEVDPRRRVALSPQRHTPISGRRRSPTTKEP